MRAMQAAQRFDDNVEMNMHTIAKLRPRAVAMTEMSNGPQDQVRVDAARRILGPAGYTVCVADDGGDHCHELVIGIRLYAGEVLDSVTIRQLSPDLGQGVWNDRHMLVVKTHDKTTKRKRAVVDTHWNAGLQGPHGNVRDIPATKATAKGSAIMESELEALLREGDVVVMGDFNYRLHDSDPLFHVWHYSPPAMFDRLGMAYHTTGLDWTGWSPSLDVAGEPVVIEPGQDGNGSDHPWSIVTLRRKATR